MTADAIITNKDRNPVPLILQNDIKRTVYHFHYLEFPDMSANVEYDVFLEFLKVVRSHIPRNIDSPIVVHCR